MSAGRVRVRPITCPQLQNDLIAVIRKYIDVADDEVDIRMERDDDVSSLEINIDLPAAEEKAAKPAKKR